MKLRERGVGVAIAILLLCGCGVGGNNNSISGNLESPNPLPQCQSTRTDSPAPVEAKNSARVQYQQTTLVVDGVKYERVSSVAVCPPGELLGFAKPGTLAEAVKSINDFQLRVISTFTALDGFYIIVPAGFERQWIAALTAQPNIINVNPNEVFAPN